MNARTPFADQRTPEAASPLALHPSGGFGFIMADPSWSFVQWSSKGQRKSADWHYACAPLDWISRLPVVASTASPHFAPSSPPPRASRPDPFGAVDSPRTCATPQGRHRHDRIHPPAGADSSLPGVTRRSLLQAAPILAVLLTALPLVAFASAKAEPAETSILSLYRQWVDLEAEANSTTDITDEELDWAVGRINDLDECTAAEPVTCAADLAAKVLVLTGVTERGATRHEADLVTECEASVAGRVAQ